MTLSLRPDDHGGLRSMEKWSNSGVGWGNHQHPILETSMGPLFYASHSHSQSMFPMGAMEQEAFVQAFVQANVDSMLDSQGVANNNNSLESLLSNSSSMVESSTSEMDEDCTAPEIRMNCISALGGGNMSPVLANMLERTTSTGASMMAAAAAAHQQSKDEYFGMNAAEASPGGSLSPGALPCGESEDSLHVADGSTVGMACLKRRFEAGEDEEWKDQMHGRKLPKHQQSEKALVFQDSFGAYAEAPSTAGVTVTYSDSLLLPSAMQQPPPLPPPFLQCSNAGGGSAVDLDKLASMRAILFRHASQPVPSLEEIASSRPKRRNVRISKDPQSVAARHRRERISDRIRVLQRLVPGGTKMDTASMLDEAIHYVKFLKLQLQTLEQIGNNNCDTRGNLQGGGAQQLATLARPFDLNCAAAFQAWPAPATTMVTKTNTKNSTSKTKNSNSQSSAQGANSTLWTSDATM